MGSGAWRPIVGAGASTVSTTVTGLTNGVTYSFTLRAHTEGGNSLASSSASATPLGLDIAPRRLWVTEGSTATYAVKLSSAPTASVMVTVARVTGGDTDLTASPTTLTFTTNNWNTAQTVTVTAAADGDGANGRAVFDHTATGAGYGGIDLAAVNARETDTANWLRVSADSVSVTEGSTATWQVKLWENAPNPPPGGVTVTITATGDTDLVVDTDTVAPGNQNILSFTSKGVYKTVTVRAAEDNDGENGETVFAHAAAGGIFSNARAGVAATEADNDTKRLVFTPASLTVAEGGTGTYKVKLGTQPTNEVTVSVGRKTGNEHDTDLSLKTGASLTFTTSNWNTDQTVTLEAAEDHDGDAGTADFEHSAAGGGYDSVTGTLQATEGENDTKGFTFSSTSVSVPEGGTASYRVKLATRPSASVTVSVARSTTGTPDTDLSVKTGSSLTFTTSNWSQNQTVTLQAAEDNDAEPGTAVFTHTAAGGGYASVTGDLTATEQENEIKGFTFTPSSVTVAEGSTASYQVKLDAPPTSSVTVTVARKAGSGHDTDLSVKTGSSLTFTTNNWNTNQTVTLEAAEDGDVADGTATFIHTAAGGGYGSVTGELEATEDDNDTVGLVFTPESVTVPEGGTVSYVVKLATQPSADVTLNVRRKTGNGQDTDLSIKTGTQLELTTSNWNTGVTVTLQAAEDDDGAAVFEHIASRGGYNNVSAELTATEGDNDTKGFTFTPASVTVNEGGTADYKVKLATKPSSDVTVTVARSTSGTQDANLSVKTGGSLTFTTSNWNTDQTVTLQAAEDDDGDAGTADIAHTAAGGGYGSVTGTVQATESDNDTKGFTFTPASVTVNEGSTASYKVKLATQPSSDVTVSVARSSTGTQDANLSVKTGSSLTFTTSNWNTDQTVTLEAAQDDDGDNGTADFAHTAVGGGYGSVTGTVQATEADNDTRAFTFTPASVTVNEGSTASYKVKLATQPSSDVTVSVARSTTGTQDANLSVKTGASLTFTSSNWNTDQTVTLEAAEDADAEAGAADFAHTAAGGGYGSVTGTVRATESDNDTKGFTFSASGVTVPEGSTVSYQVKLKTQPPSDVTVSVARSTTGTHDANLSVKTGSSLTFTSSNWNTDQTVTLEAAEDDDGDAGTADIVHTATGGGYNSITATVQATEGDNDPKGFTFSPASVSVSEGGTASYKVKLKTKPSSDVTVSVARSTTGTQDANLSVKTGGSLTFTSSNWDTDQTVTLQAAEDDDGDNGTADFSHTANGGGYGSVTGTLRATEGDNDSKGFTFSATSVSVSEGGTNSYKVKLATQPSASVTVTVARSTTGTQDANLSVKTGGSLTFTTSNWDTDQTVTLQAAEDDDGDNGTADFSHTAAGGGYASVTGTVRASESDNDTKGFTFTPASVSVGEGSTASYKVKLKTKPSASVTVSVARSTSGTQDANLSVKTGSSLTFTTSNWNTDQTVTLEAAEDDDGDNGTADFNHTANGGGYGSVTGAVRATEADNDTRGFTFTPASLSVTEGSTAGYQVKLKTKPSASVTVTVARSTSGSQDANLSVKTGGSLTFTTSNWNTNQTVTLQAAEDNDGDNGTADFNHTAAGGGYGSVTGTVQATESDNDTRGFAFTPTSVSVPEDGTAAYQVKLATQPSDDVTVSVARSTSGTQDANLSVKTGSSLTFTTSNWSTGQTVTLQAAEDDDGDNGTADFTHTASGGGYDDVTGTVQATEADDDTKGFTFTPASLSVAEGSTASYKVKLATKPSANVSVSVARSTSGTQDEDLSVKTGSSLTFTTSNWNTDQTVTLEADEDDDGDNGTADFAHTATGGGYGSVTGTVSATESDDDTKGFTLTPASVSVTEGGEASYKVKLTTKPSASVTVSVGRSTTGTQDQDLSVKSSTPLTFTTSNWNTDQTVTLQAREDDDHADGTAVFKHSGANGGYGGVTAELTATEDDNDTAAITLSTATLEVDENGEATYQVKLATKPSGNVTVTVARKSGSDQDTNLSVKSGGSLTFTTSNWNTNKTVTLQAAEDDDHADGTATFTHTASGSDYGDVTAELTATEDDNDTAAITLSTTTLDVSENGDASYKVKLATQPSANVTVTVARKSGNDQDTDLSVKTGASLTFTATNWSTDQTVTLEADEDDDHANGTAVFTHSASSGGYDNVTAELTATEGDNDTAGITLSTTTLEVDENGDASYKVKLATKPSASVTVTVARKSGNDQDTDLSVKTGGSLTFTTSNWNTDQTVTLEADEDDDHADGTAKFVHSAEDGGYDDVTAELTATEDDNDTAAITLSTATLTVNEDGEATYKVKLATQPSDDVTVSVARKSGNDQDTDLTVKSGSSLTFTTSNWNSDQDVTLRAAGDNDHANGTAVFVHSASGGGYDDVDAELTATEADSDTQALVLTPTSLTVTEGSTGDYKVKLATQPDDDVSVSVARKSTGTQDQSFTVQTGSSLTFTTSNWNTDQAVTVAAAEDSDHANGTAVIVNSASGGGYDNVTAELTVTESDNDNAALVLPTAVVVPEGGETSYSVKLASQPSADVTVEVERKSGSGQDTDLTVKTGASLTFTTSNWNNGQTVTIAAAEDDGDTTDGTAAFVHTAKDGGYDDVTAEVTATESDNDGAPTGAAIILSTSKLTVLEGKTGTYTVKLGAAPHAEVTVTLTLAGDDNISVATVTLTFGTNNWDTEQTVTVTAAEDEDTANGSATLTLTAAGGGYDGFTAKVTVTAADNDAAPAAPEVAAPDAPRIRSVVPGAGSLTLYWDYPDAATPLSGHEVGYVCPGPNGRGWQELRTGSSRRATVKGLEDGVECELQVRGFNAGGDGPWSASVFGTPNKPPRVERIVIVSQPAGGEWYLRSEETAVRVEFDEEIELGRERNGLWLALTVGEASRRAKLHDVEAKALTFRYRVAAGDRDDDGLSVEAGAIQGLGLVRDRLGMAADANGKTLADQGGHKVDADPPRLTGLGIVSSPADPDGYRRREGIELEARFDEAVVMDGGVTLPLSVGSAVRQAAVWGEPGEAVAFRYEVTSRDWDPDGVSLPPNALAGAGIRDPAGNPAVVEHMGLPDDPAHKVRGVEPPEMGAALPDLTLVAGAAPAVVDLAAAFAGEVLYVAETSAPGVASVELEGSTLRVTPLREGTSEIRVAAWNLAGRVEQRFTVTVVTDPAEIEALEASLEGFGRALLGGVSQTIGRRLESGPGGTRISLMQQDGGQNVFASDPAGLAALSGARALFLDEDPYRGGGTAGPPALALFHPLRDQFEVSLLDPVDGEDVGEDEESGLGGGEFGRDGISLWGAGQVQSFVGGGTASASYEGQMAGPFLGLDLKRGRFLVGAAMSLHVGQSEYTFSGETRGSGTLDLRMSSAYPYLGVRIGEGTEVWGIGGVGSGTVEAVRGRTGAKESADLRMRLGMGGFRTRLGSLGSMDLALRGDAGMARLETSAGSGAVARLSASPRRARVGIQGSFGLDLGFGRVAPFAEVAGRHDGGEVVSGRGLEFAGGLRMEAGQRFRLEAQGRLLALHSADGYEERGMMLLAEFRPRPDGRGLSVQLAPRWGALAQGAETLWQDEFHLLSASGFNGGRETRTLVGYGFAPDVVPGVFTPFGEVSAGWANRAFRLGLRYALMETADRQFFIELSGDRPLSGDHGAAATRYNLFGTLRY